MKIAIFLSFLFTGSAFSNVDYVISYHCGACHTSSLPSANKKALKIFDLKDTFWKETLTDFQKKDFIRRLEARMHMTDEELKYVVPRGSEVPRRPSLDEVAVVKKVFLP